MSKLFVHASSLEDHDLGLIENLTQKPLKKAKRCYLAKNVKVKKVEIAKLSHRLKIDINLIPDEFDLKNIKLVISDMDSTLINIECIDEIADFAGVKPEVAKITESAMRGEIDFPESLRQRVALLKGLDQEVMTKVYTERLKLNPGAENLARELKTMGIKLALVSGGFTFFTERLKDRLGLDFVRANVMDITMGKIAGTVGNEIIDRTAKENFLKGISKELGIDLNQTVAIGDGANDLKMMNASGLGVAYRAKDIVQQQTDVQINYGQLDLILDFLHS